MINIYQVAYKNLLRKKTRSFLTVVGIALSAWVLVSLFGFNAGYEQALNKDIDNMGFQVLVTAKGCPYEAATLMLKGGTGLRYMNQSLIGEIVKNNEVEKTIQKTRPDYIVNLSCVNKTDSEKAPERAHAVQVAGAQNCALVCKENVIRFIQFSTDMVYSGNKGTPYTLDDVPDPNIVYGKTKWEADQAITEIGGSYVIIRSPMVLGLKRLTQGSFVDWMLENIRNNTPFPLFIDHYRTPIVVDDLIDIIFRLAESDVIGTLLAGGNQDMNRVQMGRMFLDAMGKPYDLIREVYLKEVKRRNVKLRMRIN